MTFNSKGLLVTAAAALAMWLLAQAHTSLMFELAFRVALWTAVFVLSVAAIIGAVPYRQLPPLGGLLALGLSFTRNGRLAVRGDTAVVITAFICGLIYACYWLRRPRSN